MDTPVYDAYARATGNEVMMGVTTLDDVLNAAIPQLIKEALEQPTVEVQMNTGPGPWTRIDCGTCGRRVDDKPHTLQDCVLEFQSRLEER